MRFGLLLGLLLFFTSGYAMELSSPAFCQKGWIPAKYTCTGEDISPPLAWDGVASKTQSFVLILSDLDAPRGWDHWIVFNLPSTLRALPENTNLGETLSNSWGKKSYQGPCPPSGTHRYVFDLYALDTKLGLLKNSDKKLLLEKLKPHILDSGQLIGLFHNVS